jgi:Domain of unknown function (DUF4402)
MANARLPLFLVFAAGALAPAPAAAQCRLCAPAPQAAGKPPATPISIEVETGIDFSRLGLIARNQAGSAAIDPETGTRTVSGLLDLSGLPVQGSVTIRGEPNEQVTVDMPSEVTLTNPSGASLRLAGISSTLKNNPKLANDGSLTFTFGGQLLVDGGSDGDFRGRIPITVDYR